MYVYLSAKFRIVYVFYLLTGKVPQDQSLEELIKKKAAKTYEIRLDWSSVLEIIALVLAGFTIVTQISYLFFTRRNRIG